MPNIELLEKSTPVAPVRIAALAGCQDLANEVDKKLVKFRKELVAKKKPSQIPQGYSCLLYTSQIPAPGQDLHPDPHLLQVPVCPLLHTTSRALLQK